MKAQVLLVASRRAPCYRRAATQILMSFGPYAAISSRRLSPLHLLLALCVVGCLALPARALAAHAGLDLRETLAGILAYTRWPLQPDPLRLCVLGDSPHADKLLRHGVALAAPPSVLVRRPQPDAAISAQCDAVYVAGLDADRWRDLSFELAGRPVLTVCERSAACTAGGMVRLQLGPSEHQVRFEINLDAVARGTVRIHPQVLKLGRPSAPKERP